MKSVSLYIALFLGAAFGQNDAPVVAISQGTPAVGYQMIPAYSGTNLTYLCKANSNQPVSTITVSAASNASPVSFTATAHGFDYQSGATTTPVITISGATGNWTPINGTFIATPTSANAFTIAVDSTTFGALTGTLVVTTRTPLTTSLIWAIQKFVYDGSNNNIWSGWATPITGSFLSGGVPKFAFACASKTTYGYQ